MDLVPAAEDRLNFKPIFAPMNTPLSDLFTQFNSLRVLIVGDVMLDAYVWGRVDRISPEAPVPVVTVNRREVRLGGAGNVLLNVQALGAEAVICSVIGTDMAGDQLQQQLTERELNCDGLIRSASRITTIKERIIAGSQQVVRVDTETDQYIADHDRAQFINRAKELIPSCQVVIFEDYDKGVLSREAIVEITACANAHNVPTVVDPKKRHFLDYEHVTLFKPNLKELREGLKLAEPVDFNVDTPGELTRVADQLKDRMHLQGTLITLSERGVYIDFEGVQEHLPAHIRQISDVSGAGDTVISIAACCVALKQTPHRIAGLSNLGGGLVCESVGVVPINKAELLEEALRLGI